MLLRILIVTILIDGALNTQAEPIIRWYSGPPGSDGYIQSQLVYNNLVVSGHLKFDNNPSNLKNFKKGLVPVELYIDDIYKGFPQSNYLEVHVSNAVLNFPGSDLSRGQVGKKLYADYEEIRKKSGARFGISPIDIKDYIPTYESADLFWRDLFDAGNMYQGSCIAQDDEEIVIYPNKKYIFFLNVYEDKVYLGNHKNSMQSFEYSDRVANVIKDYSRVSLQRDIDFFDKEYATKFKCKRIVGFLNNYGFYVTDDEKENYKFLIHDEFSKVDPQSFYCNENAKQGINGESAAVIKKALKQYQSESAVIN